MTENPYQYFCSTQHALITMTEKTRKIPDKGGTFGSLLTDLWKAFDCITHDLLIGKLHALNFHMNALNLIFEHLTGMKQGVKLQFQFFQISTPILAHIWIYFKAFHKDQL